MAARSQLPPIGHGLDLVAVFDVASLPATLRDALPMPTNAPFRQLILVAHGGRALWSAIEREGSVGDDPVDACTERPCVTSCPAGAIGAAGFDLGACIRYRRRPDSRCRSTCIARTSCPVGAEHRYGDAQLQHHYGHSLRTILAMDDEPR